MADEIKQTKPKLTKKQQKAAVHRSAEGIVNSRAERKLRKAARNPVANDLPQADLLDDEAAVGVQVEAEAEAGPSKKRKRSENGEPDAKKKKSKSKETVEGEADAEEPAAKAKKSRLICFCGTPDLFAVMT